MMIHLGRINALVSSDVHLLRIGRPEENLVGFGGVMPQSDEGEVGGEELVLKVDDMVGWRVYYVNPPDANECKS